GADSPNEAIENMAASLADGDVVGFLETLAPSEAEFFANQQLFEEYERLEITAPDADLESFDGIDIQAENLTFAEPQKVNDQLAIAKLTGGKLTVDINPDTIPIVDDFRELVLATTENSIQGTLPDEPNDISDVFGGGDD